MLNYDRKNMAEFLEMRLILTGKGCDREKYGGNLAKKFSNNS